MERRGNHLQRRARAHYAKHEGSEPDYGILCRHRPQQHPPDPRMEPPGYSLRGDGKTVQEQQGYPRALRTAQHD